MRPQGNSNRERQPVNSNIRRTGEFEDRNRLRQNYCNINGSYEQQDHNHNQQKSNNNCYSEREPHGSERAEFHSTRRLRKTFGANAREPLQDFFTYVDNKMGQQANDAEKTEAVAEVMKGEVSSHYYNILPKQQKEGELN